MHSFIVAGTGSGPEGSRPTVNDWRLEGCRAELDFFGMIGYVLPTPDMSYPFSFNCL